MRIRTSFSNRLVTVVLIVGFSACTSFRSAETLRASGDEALARGDSSAALKSYHALLGKDDSDPDMYAIVGALLRARETIRDRTQSAKVLERGLMKYPDNVAILTETGKTYYAQTLYGDARIKFEQVLEIDPTNCTAHYYLGRNDFRRWKHVQIYRDYLINSRAHFTASLDCDSPPQDAYFKLAFGYYVLGDTMACRRITERYGIAHRDRPEPYFLLGTLAHDKEQFVEAHESFQQAFMRISDEERTHYEDILLLLPDGDEATAYEMASDDQKEELRRIFWTQHDPDLTTPNNERLVEHICRTFIADSRFSVAKMGLRGWETERGKAFIKFGPPQAYGSTLAGKFTSGRMESWTYPNGFTFFFRDEFLNGNYQVPIGPEYSYLAQIIQLDPPITSIQYTLVPVPGLIDAIAFKGSDVSSDVYVAYRVDRDSLDIFLDIDEVEAFIARSAVYDAGWHPAGFYTDTLATTDFLADSATDQGVVIKRFDLPFDEHHFAVSLEDNLTLTQSNMTADASSLRFLGSGLSVSDILLYRDSRSEIGGDVVRRGDREFYPELGARYFRDEKLRLYLEIYNLAVQGGQSRYEIAYSIYPDRRDDGMLAKVGSVIRRATGFINKPEPVISQTLLRTGTTHDEFEDLAIDIAKLDAGRYMLEINVNDGVKNADATTLRSFIKVGAARPLD